ncbi:MAG: hypothetical protein DCC58_14040 [Chloroflexi bacterium]|nr:MAG: hypothetical protein DCC58_14040 [Chloroflexota bacterium]
MSKSSDVVVQKRYVRANTFSTVIPSASRGISLLIAWRSFDFAQDDSRVAGSRVVFPCPQQR